MLKLTLRNLLARKARLVMSTLAIVLGIGFLTGVNIFSHGLNTTFDNIVRGTTPDAVVRPAGSAQSQATGTSETLVLTPTDVEAIAALPEVAEAWPGVEGRGMSLLDKDGKLVGGQGAPTMAFNYVEFKNMLGDDAISVTSGRAPTGAGEVALDSTSADNAGYAIGDQVQLVSPFGKRNQSFTLVGTVDLYGGGMAGAVMITFDTSTAQQLFLGGRDAYTSISLGAADGVSQRELAEAVQTKVPTGFAAVEGEKVAKEAEQSISQFTGVINIFLTTFAVIAIVVGGFIIANTFTILLAQRIRELALLRALGASRRQITFSVVLEALLMGLIGSTIGIVLGLLLARGLAALFKAIGLEIAGNVLDLTPATVLAAYAVGLLITVGSAYLPARRASRIPPVAAMREDAALSESSLRRRTIFGSVAICLGAALVVAGVIGTPTNDAALIGTGAVIILLAAAGISSVIGAPVLQVCRVAYARLFGITGQLAGLNALRNPRRTGATASALMIGLALVSAVGVLASSLNNTVDATVDKAFTTDYLVMSRDYNGFPASLGDDMEALPDVGAVARMQLAGAQINGKDTFIGGVNDTFADTLGLETSAGTTTLQGDQAFLDDTTADKYNATVGSTLPLLFPGDQEVKVTVVGIIKDSPMANGVNVPLSVLEGVGLKRHDFSLAIDAAKGADQAALKKQLDALVKPIPVVSVQDKQEFAKTQKKQVTMLLSIIYGLLALAIIIAVLGIMNTLGLSVIERTREIGLLRALGLTRSKLRRMVVLESVAISVMGAVLGMAIGLLIGLALRQALSDELTEVGLPLGSLLAFLLIAVVFGVLAAIAPAVRASRMPVLQAIATE